MKGEPLALLRFDVAACKQYAARGYVLERHDEGPVCDELDFRQRARGLASEDDSRGGAGFGADFIHCDERLVQDVADELDAGSDAGKILARAVFESGVHAQALQGIF